MAPVNVLHRLTFGGRLFDSESWSCTLHIDANEILPHPASAFQTALAAWMSRVETMNSVAARLDFIKFNRVTAFALPNGKKSMRYAENDTNQHLQNDMAVGVQPIGIGQDTLCVSLRTGIARGRASHGRIYPPSGRFMPDSDGRVPVATANNAAGSAATLIRDLNAVVAGAGTASVVVFSNVGQLVENVQSVRCGRVVDTMRSRRSSLDEAPVTVLINP